VSYVEVARLWLFIAMVGWVAVSGGVLMMSLREEDTFSAWWSAVTFAGASLLAACFWRFL
jgi:hypothetical protein